MDHEEYDTWNGLAPEFQLTEDHDRDHVFPKEIELLKELREKVPRAKDFPQKSLLAFLFARKHDVSRSAEFLNVHIAALDSLGIQLPTEETPIPVSFATIQKINAQKPNGSKELLFRTGLTDKMGRMLAYQRFQYVIPGSLSYDQTLTVMTFWWYSNFYVYPIASIRAGLAFVMDFHGTGFKNLDYSAEGQRIQKDTMSLFPGRIRAFYMINCNWVVTLMIKMGRLLYKKKIMDRIVQTDVLSLPERIDRDSIPYIYGGDWKVNMDSWIPSMRKMLLAEKKQFLGDDEMEVIEVEETEEDEVTKKQEKKRKKILKSQSKMLQKNQKKELKEKVKEKVKEKGKDKAGKGTQE
eukprot:TRINITY_DN7493_c0_g1_i1.p1 TRINITY_DN7493_c0_g1~~TRINITY_DN7493_c0_g1_i1.p1  ORF type:complete len:351 (+),score=90.14 TRINITY_DN7493_c0_g1_i1:18-1070(+)